MMREVVLRPDAEADVEDAADYTIQQWGAEQARAYIRELRRATEQLATTALRHSIHNTIYPGLRRKRSGMHHIYYLVTEDRVEVLNIIHVSRDPGLHFKTGT
jgi:toxin ParE1/3/4